MRKWCRSSWGVFLACICLTLAPLRFAAAESPAADSELRPELARLRAELEAVRREYDERVRALEARLVALESVARPTEQAPPAYGAASGAKPFNPDLAVIGNFVAAAGGTPSSGGEPSLEMRETELSFQAAVDPYARADFFLTVGPEEVGLEEGSLTFPALPGGLLVRVGKMRDAFGKVNAMHSHVLPFVDRPLLSTNLLGGEEGLSDFGLSVSRLVPNPWLFLEATAQVYRGESAVFRARSRADLAYVGHLRAYRDLGESTNLDLGGSVAYGRGDSAAGASSLIATDTTTRLLGADATFRYRPLRRSIYTHLLARGELAWSRSRTDEASLTAFGGYGYLEYQFARRWTAGLRYDDAERASDPGLRDKGGSFLLTFKPSEFSQLRLQLRRTRLADEEATNEVLFQALFGIGAHGAHPF